SVDGVFGILASVAQPITRWSVVYDAKRREVHWVSDRSANRKTLRFDAMALDCVSDALMLDVHSTLAGDVSSRLDPYSTQVNRDLVVSSYATTSFTRDQPQRYAEEDAAHAESFRCAGGKRRAAHP